MHDRVAAGEGRRECGQILDVGLMEDRQIERRGLPQIDAHDVVSARPELLRDEPADVAADAGHGDPHRVRSMADNVCKKAPSVSSCNPDIVATMTPARTQRAAVLGVDGTPRLEDVAAAAGVSISTASRALRDHPAVREATRRRVRSAATRLGYEPNRMASALRTRVSPFVGIVVPDITIPFFGLVVKAAQDVLEGAGYQVLVMNTHRDADQERQALRTLLSHRAGGVMVATYGGHDRGLRIPLVFFANVDEEADAQRVVLSNREGIRLLVEHLIGHGHRRIAYVGGAPVVTSGSERLLGFNASVADAGIADSALVRVSESWSAEREAGGDGAAGCARSATAFVAGGDTFALGIVKAVRAAGLRIPDDLALVSFQDPDRVGGSSSPR